ncbi:unnamed protein product, partial [Laminaria digitata]
QQQVLESRAKDPDLQPTRFLWEPYEPNNYYYETVECGRRCLLTGALVFVLPNTAGQVAGACVFAFMSLLAFELLRPHLSTTDAWMYRTGCIVIFFSNFLALMAKADISGEKTQSQELYGILLIGIHVAMVIAIIVQAYFAVQATGDSRNDYISSLTKSPSGSSMPCEADGLTTRYSSDGPVLQDVEHNDHNSVNGYKANGYDANGDKANGYDANGDKVNGYDANGHDINGYDANGDKANGYNANGYGVNGYDVNGYDKGYTDNDNMSDVGVDRGGPHVVSKQRDAFDPEDRQTGTGWSDVGISRGVTGSHKGRPHLEKQEEGHAEEEEVEDEMESALSRRSTSRIGGPLEGFRRSAVAAAAKTATLRRGKQHSRTASAESYIQGVG